MTEKQTDDSSGFPDFRFPSHATITSGMRECASAWCQMLIEGMDPRPDGAGWDTTFIASSETALSSREVSPNIKENFFWHPDNQHEHQFTVRVGNVRASVDVPKGQRERVLKQALDLAKFLVAARPVHPREGDGR